MENTKCPGKAQVIALSHLNVAYETSFSSVSERMYQNEQLGLYKGIWYSESFVVFFISPN